MLHNSFFCIFDQINEGLMSKISAMFKNIKNGYVQTFDQYCTSVW